MNYYGISCDANDEDHEKNSTFHLLRVKDKLGLNDAIITNSGVYKLTPEQQSERQTSIGPFIPVSDKAIDYFLSSPETV